MLQFLYDRSTKRNTIIAFIATVLIMLVMNGIATAFYNSTGGYGILDMAGGANLTDSRSPILSESETNDLLKHYGEQGIRAHKMILIGDLVLPTSLTISFCFLIGLLYRIRTNEISAPKAMYIPLAYLAFDSLENLVICRILFSYPEPAGNLAFPLNLLRTAKFVASGVMVVISIFYFLKLLSEKP
ncbi:hypothetical protein LEP1GSC058_3689 [Leptospira fainei serovar Hurstbridge str. BUT 6]|uniref:Uncharacterized protein n=1 Tax=Leptospira fainei serovar Hurstbridge str. BUT 6 TaxID=1193011 RepID=S3V9D5_9LEPT|nr:hypothetical protein [Leptospira fainei]EPG73005.1 hypothetical protein LEP1GSC058_3689 [Leptospira fainei serovar Hurstbridge str. BUT 6]